MNWSVSMPDLHLWYIPFHSEEKSVDCLSHEELEHGNKFKFDIHRDKFFFYRTSLRKILSLYLSVNPQEIIFEYGEFGKPRVLNNVASIEFNLSHSGNLGIVGITKKLVIGVDVEILNSLDNLNAIVQQYFSKYEWKKFRIFPEQKKFIYFYRLWTCKEAYIKALGAGLSYPLDKFSIDFLPEGYPRIVEIDSKMQENISWTLQSYLLKSGLESYVIAYALNTEQLAVSTHLMYDARTPL